MHPSFTGTTSSGAIFGLHSVNWCLSRYSYSWPTTTSCLKTLSPQIIFIFWLNAISFGVNVPPRPHNSPFWWYNLDASNWWLSIYIGACMWTRWIDISAWRYKIKRHDTIECLKTLTAQVGIRFYTPNWDSIHAESPCFRAAVIPSGTRIFYIAYIWVLRHSVYHYKPDVKYVIINILWLWTEMEPVYIVARNICIWTLAEPRVSIFYCRTKFSSSS